MYGGAGIKTAGSWDESEEIRWNKKITAILILF